MNHHLFCYRIAIVWLPAIVTHWMLLFPVAFGDDWPQWRGPNRNGVSTESLPEQGWMKGSPKLAWQAQVGIGFSSVVISEGRLFTVGNSDEQDTMVCLDAQSGKRIWSSSYPAPLDDRFFEGGPTSTPTVDGDRVYFLSRAGELYCWRVSTGEMLWSKNIPEETKHRIPGWGFSASPVVHENLLILGIGESGMALEKRTGEKVWESGKGEAGYMTPLPFRLENDWHCLIASGKFYQCVELPTGKILWKHRWLTTYGCNAADPIIRGSEAFISSGYGRGSAKLELRKDGYEVSWSHKDMQNQLQSSVLIDGMIYGFDGDEGGEVQLKCLEWETGKVRWAVPGLGSGSLTATSKHLILLSEQGEFVVASASPEAFTPVFRFQAMDGKCWTVPVLSNGYIYCRNVLGDLKGFDVHSPTKE